MSPEEMAAVLSRRSDNSFEKALKKAISDIDKRFDSVEERFGEHATNYVCSLVRKMPKECRVEGRRGQVLRDAVLAAMALQRAEPDRDLSDTIWTVVHDMLVYGKLSGLKIKEAELKTAHQTAFTAMGNMDAETMVADAPTLSDKIRLLIANHKSISAPTKAAVFGEELSKCADLVTKLACKKLFETKLFAKEPAHLKEIVERLPLPDVQFKVNAGKLRRMNRLSSANGAIFEAADGDEEQMKILTQQVDALLATWGLSPEVIASAPSIEAEAAQAATAA